MTPLVRLDSSRTDSPGEDWRRNVGPAQRTLRCDAVGAAHLVDAAGKIVRSWSEPLEPLQWLDSAREAESRWIGYLSYDLGRFLEPAVEQRHPSRFPLYVFSQHAFGSSGEPDSTAHSLISSRTLHANFAREGYLAAVSRAIEYIAAGDIFQVNLAQQLRLQTDSSAKQIYRCLQERFPAWYAALLDYGNFAILSNSPELYLRTWRDGEKTKIETRPIKGTRPRSHGMRKKLRESIKDQAELNMIVDLERNDLGRICRMGSVRVTEPRTIEQHPTVYHGAATITGELRENVGLLEILRATFPGGSITGAPKIRAMQIIDELEPQARGPYCGAIGYLDAGGVMQFSIAIRTLLMQGRNVSIPVGGGIVADSDPNAEYEETLVKARAALAALGANDMEISGE